MVKGILSFMKSLPSQYVPLITPQMEILTTVPTITIDDDYDYDDDDDDDDDDKMMMMTMMMMIR